MKWFVQKLLNNGLLTRYDTVIGGEDDLRMTLRHRYDVHSYTIESIIEDLRKDNVTSTKLTRDDDNTVISVTKAYNEQAD